MAEKEENLVKLNVGGKIFLASPNTLKAEPASKLANLVDGGGIKDDSGAFFIDSSPDLFSIILNWCRFKVITLFLYFSLFLFQVLSAGPQVDLPLLERVANDLRLEEMGKVVREKIAAEASRHGKEERQRERKQQEIMERLDTIILAIHALGSHGHTPGPKGPQPFPYPPPDPDFI